MCKKTSTFLFALALAGGLAAQERTNNQIYGNFDTPKGGVCRSMAQNDTKSITFSTSDIQFWCGQGTNQAVVICAWDDASTPTALVWGVRWSGSAVAIDLIDSIATYDSRFSYQFASSLISDVEYHDETTNLVSSNDWWCYYVNGDWASGYGDQGMANGDVIEMSASCSWTMTDAVAATNPNSDTVADATIAADAIEYWVGSGSNQLVFAVNWADTALAWGYRFASDSVMLSTVMHDIADGDPRFSYLGNAYLDDILFVESDDTLRITTGHYWEHTLNGHSSIGMTQWMHNGDFSRWADPSAGVAVDSFYYEGYGWSYSYAYPQTIYPVSVPTVVGSFCGAVGTEGCTAIECTDSRIKAWATSCSIVRGSQDLSNSDAPMVTYGTEHDAVGAATSGTMDVVSLGDGGSATLIFAHPIINGDGHDFAVFENSFNDVFLELAFVEVSSDGENFVRFPATSLTQTATQIGSSGSVDPTYIDNLAGKYRVGWGTPFDLDQLRDSAGIDINHVTHVRIVDVVGSIDSQYGTYDAYGHIINDPFPSVSYSAGFDLDGVAVLHQDSSSIGICYEVAGHFELYPNPANSAVWIQLPSNQAYGNLAIYNASGSKMMCQPLTAARQLVYIDALPNGIYFVNITTHRGVCTRKLIIRH